MAIPGKPERVRVWAAPLPRIFFMVTVPVELTTPFLGGSVDRAGRLGQVALSAHRIRPLTKSALLRDPYALRG